MDRTSLVVMGVFVLLNWLHVAFFDRIQRWRTPWDRWARVRPNMLPVLKVLAIGLSVLLSVVFVLMVTAAAAG